MTVMKKTQRLHPSLGLCETTYYVECWELDTLQDIINNYAELVANPESDIVEFEIIHLSNVQRLNNLENMRQIIHYSLKREKQQDED